VTGRPAHSVWDRIQTRLVRMLLLLFPADFRREYGEEWRLAIEHRLSEARDESDILQRARLRLGLAADTLKAAVGVRVGTKPSRLMTPRGSAPMLSFVHDIRFGVRALRRRPVFAAITIGTLALGIGATTAVFSVLEAVVLRPLPYDDPEDLVQIWETFPDWLDHPQLRDDWDVVYLAWPDYIRLRDGTTQFQAVGGYDFTAGILAGAGRPERAEVGVASSTLLATLGVDPWIGRGFVQGEDGPDAPHVMMIAHSFWVERYGGATDALGSTVSLDGLPRW